MPRQARIDGAGALHHIICRGIEGKVIFSDDLDRDDFVSRLETVLVQTSTRCYAWALLPNHFHLLLQTGSVPVATVMRKLLTGYATKLNRRHGSTDTSSRTVTIRFSARRSHTFSNWYAISI